MGFLITADGVSGNTSVPNDVILHYIIRANGEHVKVYLYLLMACQYPGLTGQVSVESLADRLECTERDIVRALRFWEREGLLSISGDGENIDGITLHDLDTEVYDSDRTFVDTQVPHLKVLKNQPEERMIPEDDSIPIPERTDYSEDVIDALTRDKEMKKTLNAVEKALKNPLSQTHMQLVMYLVCDLGFSSELVSYLYELAASRGKTKPRYIETIAINWAKKGITTPEEAKEESSEYSGKYLIIRKALGIHRDLAPAEKEIIDGWSEYSFTQDILEEACRRTVLQTGDTNLNYVSKILASWYASGVRMYSDIEKVDDDYKKKKASEPRTNPRARTRTPSRNAFQNFKQRDYSDEDYEALEQMLLRKESQ
ncbi:MAG: DnaD domain protein [Eubacterium sp.]|nr:DnaD domain protein [Eubacterium sp.]